jgi:predicted DNA-binding protein YlxM (UPF0122 family)
MGYVHAEKIDPFAVERTLDAFADFLADDLPLNDIADRLKITRGSACAYYRMLKERFGDQAN